MKCPDCGKDIVKYPLFKKVGKRKVFIKENWPNLFKMDMQSIILFVIVIGMVFGYKADMAMCEDAIERPCEFCNNTGCCEYKTYDSGYDLKFPLDNILNETSNYPHPE